MKEKKNGGMRTRGRVFGKEKLVVLPLEYGRIVLWSHDEHVDRHVGMSLRSSSVGGSDEKLKDLTFC